MSDPDPIIVPATTVRPHFQDKQYSELARVILNLLILPIIDRLSRIYGDISHDVQCVTNRESLPVKQDILRMRYRPSVPMANSPLGDIELYLVVETHANDADGIPNHQVIVRYQNQVIDLANNVHVTYLGGDSLDGNTPMLDYSQLTAALYLTIKLNVILVKILSAEATSQTS